MICLFLLIVALSLSRGHCHDEVVGRTADLDRHGSVLSSLQNQRASAATDMKRRLLPNKTARRVQREAMLSWSRSLTAADYGPAHWRAMKEAMTVPKPGPPQFFDVYIRKLSDMFQTAGASVNFISIGACDGTNDLTIKRFLSFPRKTARTHASNTVHLVSTPSPVIASRLASNVHRACVY